MHILFLTPQLPYPPRQGTSIRNFHLVARLAQHHTVDLISFLAADDEAATDGPLHRLCRRIATVAQPTRSLAARLQTTLLSPLPDMALRLESAAMHELVAAWTRDTVYDIVQIEGIELMQYAAHVDPARTAVVFDNHNCEYLLQKRNALTDLAHPMRWHAAAYSLVQWAKLRRYEAAMCHRATATIAVSRPDQVALQHIAPHANIVVAPNGVDLSAYATFATQDTSRGERHQQVTLLFTGKMDYRPNIDAVLWFVREVMPAVVAAEPQVRLQIVGKNPHPRLAALRHHTNVEITGTVPDTLPYLQAADIFIIPMRVGGGTRFKALEAMAAGKAIVSTTLGIEGIGITHKREMLIADAPDEFALAILRLIADQRAGGDLTQRLVQNARAFVADGYTWDRIIPVVERLYLQVKPDHTSSNPRRFVPETS